MKIGIRYWNQVINSIQGAELEDSRNASNRFLGKSSKFRLLQKLELHPCLDADGDVMWKSTHPALEFSPAQVGEYFLKTLVDLLEKLQGENDKR